MILDAIRSKIEALVQLADRPGTYAEGEAARTAAIRLSLKYKIPCKFAHVVQQTKPVDSGATIIPAPAMDVVFDQWIQALRHHGWYILNYCDCKIGRQIRFRHSHVQSELRVTQRANGDWQDFEAEHVMQPDAVDEGGHDLSYTSFMTISLKNLLRHITYATDSSPEKPTFQSTPKTKPKPSSESWLPNDYLKQYQS